LKGAKGRNWLAKPPLSVIPLHKMRTQPECAYCRIPPANQEITQKLGPDSAGVAQCAVREFHLSTSFLFLNFD
jgi:hypothetical protein